jgi:hypothetical protein
MVRTGEYALNFLPAHGITTLTPEIRSRIETRWLWRSSSAAL